MNSSRPERVPLAQTPTPLQHLPRLSARTGVDFWIKRDDLTGDIGLGGNKVRKLEYLLGEALELGATHLLTTGGPQSNHARATAAAAARAGLSCVLILAGHDPGTRRGNLLLDELYGAEVRFPGAVTPEDQDRMLQEAAARLASQGARPYVIPIGASTPAGVLGSMACYTEMADLLAPGAWVCCASGTGGTHAGLALGAARQGGQVRIQGFAVWQGSEYLLPVTAALANGAARLMEPRPVRLPEIHVEDRFLVPRYGRPSPEGVEAIRLLASLEGILLDHVYTGKAMAGVLSYIHSGTIPRGTRVVFVHTGGAPALFDRFGDGIWPAGD